MGPAVHICSRAGWAATRAQGVVWPIQCTLELATDTVPGARSTYLLQLQLSPAPVVRIGVQARGEQASDGSRVHLGQVYDDVEASGWAGGRSRRGRRWLLMCCAHSGQGGRMAGHLSLDAAGERTPVGSAAVWHARGSEGSRGQATIGLCRARAAGGYRGARRAGRVRGAN